MATLALQCTTRFFNRNFSFCCVTVNQRTTSTLQSSDLQNKKLLSKNSSTADPVSVTIFLNSKGTVDDVSPELLEFLAYVENTTDAFADQAESDWIKKLHERVKAVKQSREMEVEYLTLLQRDRENLEEGLELGARIIKLYINGADSEKIASSLKLNLEYVEKTIANYESD